MQVDSNFYSKAQYLIGKIECMMSYAPTPVENVMRGVVGEVLVKDIQREHREALDCLTQLELTHPELEEFIKAEINPEISFLFQELLTHQKRNWLGLPVFKNRDVLFFTDACKRLLHKIKVKVDVLQAQQLKKKTKNATPQEKKPFFWSIFNKQ